MKSQSVKKPHSMPTRPQVITKSPTPATTPSLCPITTVARLLSDTWTMLIMHTFIQHPDTTRTTSATIRFCELERALPGISTRTLTNKLKLIESEGLVTKTETGYQATKKGLGLRVIEDAMRTYERNYLA